MRNAVWLVLLFAGAGLAATLLGSNDGLATFYWGGWRLEISLNLFVVLLVLVCVALVVLIQAADLLLGLPRRAREWRGTRRDRNAQLALREALAQYFAGRYSRSQKAALRALQIQLDAPELGEDREFTVLAHLLAAGSSHRLQDRAGRDAQLQQALLHGTRAGTLRPADEGARLLAAEWALDDRDAPRAIELLSALPVGVARRTQALRLKLQASRLARQPQEALRTARLLAKHQGFSPTAARGLLRSLAFELLATARDADQLRAVWNELDATERRDAFVCARAATLATGFGAQGDAREWLRPLWDGVAELPEDERGAVAMALAGATPGIAADWLPRLEAAERALPRDGRVALAVGEAYAERQIWGKARGLLEQAAADVALPAAARRSAARRLALLAREQGDEQGAARGFEAAAGHG
jgi:HemY protein